MQVPQLPLMPRQASTFAGNVDTLYLALWALTLVIMVIVTVALIYFVIKYRRRSPDEIPQQIAGAIKLESGFMVFMFIIFMGIFVFGAKVYFAQYRMPKTALDIHVTGKQWMWKFQHPTGQREINELHLPVGTKVKFTMTTEDVIHSLYFPDLRVKSDVVPGRYSYMWLEATQEGEFKIFCAEYCGTNHSGMGGRLIVMKPTDYQAWLAGNLNNLSPVDAGREKYQALGCASCHGANAEGGRCPTLNGVFASQVQLVGGNSVEADEDYIRESILNPAAKIVAGYPAIMPTYQGQLTEEELLQLVTYIKSLAPAQTDGISTNAPALSNNPSAGAPTLEGQGASNPDAFRANPIGATAPSGGGTSSTPGAGQSNGTGIRPENR
ncbi:MAG: cytochrome c oxidase subunit II [Pyrinomonadaceae bacterium MAG19_C2-C3]|nr:cytochrome c oxidase subunit II [Pyrinomonadaceae bacterium MAG19_C2-C3]